MYSKSLPELASQFVSYKKANGYQYETGAYYLKKYVRFVMETAPETAVPDKASVEGFLERLQDTPGGLYNAAAFLREFSRYLHARGLKAYLIPSGRLHPPTPAQPYFFTEDEIIAFFMECDRMPDTPYLKGRHLSSPRSSGLCTAVGSAVKRHAHLPGKTYIWIRVISMSSSPRGPRAGESIFPKNLRNIWLAMTAGSAACSRTARSFSQTGKAVHTVPAGWNGTSCVSGIPLSRKRRIGASASVHIISDITLSMPT